MSVPAQIARRLFDVSEYYRMAEAGIFHEDDRVELIEGEVVKMSPIGSRHAGCLKDVSALLHEQLGRKAVVGVQDPLRIDEKTEPQPDLTILKPGKYRQRHPVPADVLLIVEIADSSEAYDRDVKVPLYSRSGIPEVWLVRLLADSIRVYRTPENGAYRDVRDVGRGQALSPALLPDVALSADDILG